MRCGEGFRALRILRIVLRVVKCGRARRLGRAGGRIQGGRCGDSRECVCEVIQILFRLADLGARIRILVQHRAEEIPE